MIISSIELVGFKRFALNQIRRFILKPQERVQLILGTNGSGKSSLLRELTPLPADHKAYQKDGSKTITIVHQGNNYVLRSHFANGNKHSFKKNDVELNEGGTVTVQKELVWQEFKIDEQVHGLMTDDELFHSMAPARRRIWFTRLSDVSFDYALSVYERLKERYRDTVGTLKKTKERLVAETNKIVSKEEQERLEQEVRFLHKAIDDLQAVRAPVEHNGQWYHERMNQLISQLHLGFDFIFKESQTLIPLSRQYDSFEHIESLIDQIRHKTTATQTTINNAMQEHGKFNQQYKILQETNGQGVEIIKKNLQVAREARIALLSDRRLGLEGLDAPNAKSAFASIYSVLFDLFSSIPDNADRRFSQAKGRAYQEELQLAKGSLTTIEFALSKAIQEKKLLEAHRHDQGVVCPQCAYKWNLNFSEAKYEKILETISGYENNLLEHQKNVASIEENIRQYESYLNQYYQYREIVRSWPVLNPYWDYLETNQLVVNYPNKALDSLRILEDDIEKEISITLKDKEINEFLLLIKKAEEVGDASLSDVQASMDYYAKIVEDNTRLLTKLSQDERNLTEQLRDFKSLHNRAQKITEILEQSFELISDSLEMKFREFIQETIQSYQVQLARKVEALQEMRLQKGIIADIERNIEFLSIEEEALKLLVKEMSPTEGLIADGLLGFIRIFVNQMNQVIKKIWTYPLEIQHCGISTEQGAELDYKFPIMVDTRSNIVDDVKNGSNGMHEAVDLAFKLVAMKHLGLEDAPLLLDEFGVALDAEHRVTATHAIKQIIDQHMNSQVFLISHYQDHYGALTNAQICVLDSRNIVIPDNKKYNQHVTMD